MSIEPFIHGYIVHEESYSKNDQIIKEGSKGDWVYVVLEGQVKVKKLIKKGMITIDTLKEGDIFGEMILWQAGKGQRSAYVVADSQVKVGLLNTERLLQDYEAVSPRLKSLIHSLMMRLGEATKNTSILAVELN